MRLFAVVFQLFCLELADKVEVLLTVQNEIIIFAAGYGRRDYIGIERIVGNNKQISIPAEYRRVLGLKANVEVEIFLTAQKEIIVKPYNKTSVQNVRTLYRIRTSRSFRPETCGGGKGSGKSPATTEHAQSRFSNRSLQVAVLCRAVRSHNRSPF